MTIAKTQHQQVPQEGTTDTQGIILTVLKARRTAQQSGIHGVRLVVACPGDDQVATLAAAHIFDQLKADGHTNCGFDDRSGTIIINLT